MRINFTGAAGFIGSHLRKKLANLSHQVTGIDSFNENYPASTCFHKRTKCDSHDALGS